MASEEKTKVDWKKVIAGVGETLKFFNGQGVRPTLRALFYNLVSRQLIPNTRSSYKVFSRCFVQARKNGLYAWNSIDDTSRRVYGELADTYYVEGAKEETKNNLAEALDSLENVDNLLDSYFLCSEETPKVLPWAIQPNAVVVWLEKEALVGIIWSWVGNLSVPISVGKGYPSWTFIYNGAESLKSLLETHDKVTILYLGDLDPSGVDIDRYLKEALQYFKLDASKVEFIRLAITKEQVDKYTLPPRPEDADTLAKLGRDPRNARYAFPFVVELDALVAFVPDKFKEELVKAIKDRWDSDLYAEFKEEAEEAQKEIDGLIEATKLEAKSKLRDMEPF